MKIKLLNSDIKCPEIKHKGDGGYDIYLPEHVIFLPHMIKTINSGIACEIPEGYVGMLVIRSSVATKNALIIQSPLIDSNYRGEIHLIVYNASSEWIEYKKGDRICSLVLFKIDTPELKVVDKLSETNRGENWNGSSGK